MAGDTRSIVWEAVLTTAGFEAGLRVIGSGIQGILGTMQSVASGITSTLSAAFNAVVNVVRTIASTIGSLLSAAFQVVTGVAQAFIGALTGGFSAISGLIGSVAGLVSGVLAGAFNVLSSVVTGVFDIIQTAAQAAFDILTSIATISFEALVVGVMAVVAALGYLAVTGTKAYANIEMAAMNTANTIAASTGKSFEAAKSQYMDTVEEITKHTDKTMEDVGTSMSAALLRGITENPSATPQELAQQLLPIAQMSEAVDAPLKDVSDFVTSQMGQWGLGFDQLSAYVDSATNASKLSKMSFEDFSSIMNNSASTAKAAGMGYNDLAAMIETLGQTYMPAQQIMMGTRLELAKLPSLVNDLDKAYGKAADDQDKYTTKMEKWTKGAAEAAAKGKEYTTAMPTAPEAAAENTPTGVLMAHGVKPEELDLTKNSIADIAANLKDIHGLTFQDFQEVFGSGRTGAATTMWTLASNTDKFDQNLQKLDHDSAGAAKTYSDRLAPSLTMTMDKVGSSLSILANKFGEILGPGIADNLNKYVIPTIDTLANALERLLKGDFKGFTDGINTLIDGIKNNLTYEKAFNAGKWIVDQIAKGIKAAGGIHWDTLWDTLKTSFVGAMEGIRTSIKNNFDVDIAEIYNSWREGFLGIADNVITAMESVGEVVIRTASAIVSVLQWAMSQDYGTLLYTGMSTAGQAIIDIFIIVASEIYNLIVTAIQEAMSYVEHLPSTILGGMLSKLGVPQEYIDKITNPNMFSQTEQDQNTRNQIPPTVSTGETQRIGDNQFVDHYGTNWSYDKNGVAQPTGYNPTYDQSASGQESSGSGAGSASAYNTASSISQGKQTAAEGAASYSGVDISGNNKGTFVTKSSGVSSMLNSASPSTGSALTSGNGKNIISSAVFDAFASTGLNALKIDVPAAIEKGNDVYWKKLEELFPQYSKQTAQDITAGLTKAATEGFTTKADPLVSSFKGTMEGVRTTMHDSIGEWTGAVKQSADSNTDVSNSILSNLNTLINGVKDNSSATNDNTDATNWAGTNAKDAGTNAKDAAAKVTEQLHAQSVGYDALKDAMNGCTETMSQFGQQQESNPDLFYGSYIGASGPEYDAYKANETNRIIQAANSASANGAVLIGSIQDYVGMTPVEVPVTGDTSGLTESANTATSNIEAMNPSISISGDNSGAIQAGYDAVAAINSMMASIAIDAGGGYGAGGPTPESQYGSGDVLSNLSSLISGEYATGTDFVPYDQVAKLHRGEAVITAEENKQADRGIIQLTYAPTTIIGTRTDKAEVERLIRDMQDKHTMDIEKMLTNKAKGNR